MAAKVTSIMIKKKAASRIRLQTWEIEKYLWHLRISKYVVYDLKVLDL